MAKVFSSLLSNRVSIQIQWDESLADNGREKISENQLLCFVLNHQPNIAHLYLQFDYRWGWVYWVSMNEG